MRLLRRISLAAILLVAFATGVSAQTTRVRATIDAVNGDVLTLTARDGAHLTVSVGDKAAIMAVLPSNLADIKSGSYIGTAALPGKGGVLMALEVHVFAEALRGVGDGHRPFDLQPESTMTNGTVGDVTASNGDTLTVAYKGGQQTVMVPPGTPIVTVTPGGRDLLVPGAHVYIFVDKAADGSLTASRVLAGKDGLVPPM